MYLFCGNDKNKLFSVKPNRFFKFHNRSNESTKNQESRSSSAYVLRHDLVFGRIGSWLKQTPLQIHWTLLLFTQCVAPNKKWHSVRYFAISSEVIRNTKRTNFTSWISLILEFSLNVIEIQWILWIQQIWQNRWCMTI